MSTVTIEYEGEKIECAESDAAKELAKLKRRAAKQERERQGRRDEARKRASLAFACIVDTVCVILDENSARYFRIHEQGSDTFRRAVGFKDGELGEWLRVYAEDNSLCETRFYGYRITGAIESGAGFVIAVRLADERGAHWAAVGAYGGMVAIQEFPPRIGAMIEEAANKRALERAA